MECWEQNNKRRRTISLPLKRWGTLFSLSLWLLNLPLPKLGILKASVPMWMKVEGVGKGRGAGRGRWYIIYPNISSNFSKNKVLYVPLSPVNSFLIFWLWLLTYLMPSYLPAHTHSFHFILLYFGMQLRGMQKKPWPLTSYRPGFTCWAPPLHRVGYSTSARLNLSVNYKNCVY